MRSLPFGLLVPVYFPFWFQGQGFGSDVVAYFLLLKLLSRMENCQWPYCAFYINNYLSFDHALPSLNKMA